MEENDRPEERRRSSLIDRRSGEDRRSVYSLDYFAAGGVERRSGKDRRQPDERRSGCVRVTEWSSVCLDEKEK